MIPLCRALRLSQSRLLYPKLKFTRFQHTDRQPPSTKVGKNPQQQHSDDQVTRRINLNRPISQPTYFTHPHLLKPSEITHGVSRVEYQVRRQRLASILPPNSVSIFTSNPQLYMSEDVPYPYHPNTDLVYLTGIYEAEATLLVHRKGSGAETNFTLFVADRDPVKELWDGHTCGHGEETQRYFSIDGIRSLKDIGDVVNDLIPTCDSFHYDSSNNPSSTNLIFSKFVSNNQHEQILKQKWKRNAPPKTFVLPLRIKKSRAELDLLKKASSITANSLNSVMAHTSTDSSESIIDGQLIYEHSLRGSTRMAFPSVVASGKNATILHYMHKTSLLKSNDLIMIDTGCEYHNYCSDVSRTWPVSSKFTSQQKDLYSLVLHTQKEIIHSVKPNEISLDSLHIQSSQIITQGLIDLGIIKNTTVQLALTSGITAKYFPHAIGHYLGADVHDTHQISKAITLQPNMVITVEPGIYIPPNDHTVPEGFRGIGIRIEDDVVVPEIGETPDVMSHEAVKEIDDVEQLVGSQVAGKNR